MGWTKDGIGPALNPTARSVLSRRERSAAKMPQVAVMTSGAAQKQTRDEETKSYRKTQKIVVGVNGTISGAPLDLGAAGDCNVTAIEFDTSALDWYQSHLENYEATLTFCTANNPSTYYTYRFDGELFPVPADITIEGVEWYVIFALKEKLDDDTSGNVEEPQEQEIFISEQFTATTTIPSHASNWTEEDFETAQSEDERESLVALTKDTSNAQMVTTDWLISWSENETDSFLGYKKDNYIKQFKIVKLVEMNTFNNWYVSFINRTLGKKVLLRLEGTSQSFAWIIPEITAEASDQWEVSVIARDEMNNATYYSNILAAARIENNFLQSLDWLVPNKEIITVSSNLFSSDDYYFMGSDGLILAAMEE